MTHITLRNRIIRFIHRKQYLIGIYAMTVIGFCFLFSVMLSARYGSISIYGR